MAVRSMAFQHVELEDVHPHQSRKEISERLYRIAADEQYNECKHDFAQEKEQNTMFVDVVHGRIAADEQYNERTKQKNIHTNTPSMQNYEHAESQTSIDAGHKQLTISHH